MDKEHIKIWKKKFKDFLVSEDSFIEIPVGDDIRKRNDVPYKIIYSSFGIAVYYFRHFLSRIAQKIDYSPIKILIYRMIGFKIGKGVYIAPDVILDTQYPSLVEIGDYAVLGWGSKIFVHDYNGVYYRIGRVKIGKGTVVGGFSFIRAGVTIDDMSLVKLGSTIFQNKTPNTITQNQVKEIFNKDKGEF